MVATRYTCDTCLCDFEIDVAEDQRDALRQCKCRKGRLVRAVSMSDVPELAKEIVQRAARRVVREVRDHATPLGIANFAVAQWFGVRIVRDIQLTPKGMHTSYDVILPVLPLTGWVTDYTPARPQRLSRMLRGDKPRTGSTPKRRATRVEDDDQED